MYSKCGVGGGAVKPFHSYFLNGAALTRSQQLNDTMLANLKEININFFDSLYSWIWIKLDYLCEARDNPTFHQAVYYVTA